MTVISGVRYNWEVALKLTESSGMICKRSRLLFHFTDECPFQPTHERDILLRAGWIIVAPVICREATPIFMCSCSKFALIQPLFRPNVEPYSLWIAFVQARMPSLVLLGLLSIQNLGRVHVRSRRRIAFLGPSRSASAHKAGRDDCNSA